jgi:hypothetical protein
MVDFIHCCHYVIYTFNAIYLNIPLSKNGITIKLGQFNNGILSKLYTLNGKKRIVSKYYSITVEMEMD